MDSNLDKLAIIQNSLNTIARKNDLFAEMEKSIACVQKAINEIVQSSAFRSTSETIIDFLKNTEEIGLALTPAIKAISEQQKYFASMFKSSAFEAFYKNISEMENLLLNLDTFSIATNALEKYNQYFDEETSEEIQHIEHEAKNQQGYISPASRIRLIEFIISVIVTLLTLVGIYNDIQGQKQQEIIIYQQQEILEDAENLIKLLNEIADTGEGITDCSDNITDDADVILKPENND